MANHGKPAKLRESKIGKTGPKLKKTCKRGHDLSITGRRTPKGIAYCNGCQNERQKGYRNRHRQRYRDANRKARLKTTYGISPTDVSDMISDQNGCCAICNTDAPGAKGFHIDHNHETGKIRGLLCGFCNSGLGFFRDNPKLMRRAATYVTADGVK